jgi:hypothetical protein
MQKSTFSRENTDEPVNLEETRNCQPEERRCENRRRKKCDGYVHLPAVGWYCRRLKTRRETDIYAKDLF